MSFNLGRERPAKGLLIMHNENDKFRSESIVVRLITPLDEKTSQRLVALNMLMGESNSLYPDKQQFSRRLTGLYGAIFNRFCYTSGDCLVSGFSIISIADRFAKGEQVTSELAKILLCSIFEPDIGDGRFNEVYFENIRHDVISKIKSLKANRHSYAVKRAAEVAFEGEPAAVNLLGTIEDAEALTNEQLVESYHKLMDTAFVSISFCGGGTNKEAQKLVTERFTEFCNSRDYTGIEYEKTASPSAPKAEPRYVTEQLEQSQSKLVMIFKSDCKNEFALKMGVMLYGGTAFSKLFMNVREKMSLCYYCQASIMGTKGGVMVDSGVGHGNEEKARNEILRQLELLKQGDFTDEELEDAKRSYTGSLRSVYDFADDLNAWFFRRFEQGDMLTPNDAAELANAVTREEVMEALSTMKLDTVYVCEPTETAEEGENAE